MVSARKAFRGDVPLRSGKSVYEPEISPTGVAIQDGSKYESQR